MSVNKCESNLTVGEEKQLVKAEGFLSLRRDVLFIILGLLSYKNLKNVALVNRKACVLSRKISLNRFKTELQYSNFWKSFYPVFIQITKNKSYKDVAYMKKNTPREIHVSDYSKELNDKLYESLAAFNRNFKRYYSLFQVHIFSFVEVQNKIHEIFRWLLKNSEISVIASSSTLNEFINLSDEKDRYIIWKQYYQIDKILSTVELLNNLKKLPDNQRLQYFVLSNLKRSLNLMDFFLLDEVFSGLFSGFLLELLNLFRSNNKAIHDSKTLIEIERFISEISDQDFEDYFCNGVQYYEGGRYYCKKLEIVKKALFSNCNVLINKMGPEFFLKLAYRCSYSVHVNSHIEEIIICLFLNSTMLGKFDKRQINELLSIHLFHHIRQDFSDGVELYSKLNYFTVLNILEKIEGNARLQSRFVGLCLSQHAAIKNYSHDQIVFLFKYLGKYDFKRLLADGKCFDRLEFKKKEELFLFFLNDDKLIDLSLILILDNDYGKMAAKNNYDIISSFMSKIIEVCPVDYLISVMISHPMIGIFIIENYNYILSLSDLVYIENFFFEIDVNLDRFKLYNLVKSRRILLQSISMSEDYEYWQPLFLRRKLLKRKSAEKNIKQFYYRSFFRYVLLLIQFIIIPIFLIFYYIKNTIELYSCFDSIKNSYFFYFIDSIDSFLDSIVQKIIQYYIVYCDEMANIFYHDLPKMDIAIRPQYYFFPIKMRRGQSLTADKDQIPFPDTYYIDSFQRLCFVIQCVSVFGAMIGLLLVGAGLAASAGISVMMLIVKVIFSFFPVSSSLASILVGSLIYFISLTTCLISSAMSQISENPVTIELPEKIDSDPFKGQNERLSLNRFCINNHSSLNPLDKAAFYPECSDSNSSSVDLVNDDGADDGMVFKL